jgi:acetylornithine deacetylase/succinyl-diaminopimelate desuccinylase-like protein
MKQVLDENVLQYLEGAKEETIALIEALCRIPAPSKHEERRAEFCKNWLEQQGAKGVYIDGVNNVVYPVGCEQATEITLFCAHTDTVFPDTEPMPFTKDETYMYSPGVGDDTACLAVLMMVAKYVAQNNLQPKHGVLFVANSCEEGLGNLKGCRKIMECYGSRISEFVSLDSSCMNRMVCEAVGSHRYNVTVRTEGGHSFGNFGNRNAIHVLATLINTLYSVKVPREGSSKTTYNTTINGKSTFPDFENIREVIFVVVPLENNIVSSCTYNSTNNAVNKYINHVIKTHFPCISLSSTEKSSKDKSECNKHTVKLDCDNSVTHRDFK